MRKIYTFTIPRDTFDETQPDKRVIRNLIREHIAIAQHLHANMDYYKGKHKITTEENRQNKLVCNHAHDISDTAFSYFIGNPIAYTCKDDITPLTDALELAGADEADGDNGLELSIYGLAYEYIYLKEDENDLCIKNLSAEHTFMVKDDSIEEKELFAVYYYIRKDDSRKERDHFIATVLTKSFKYELDIEDCDEPQTMDEIGKEHFLGDIPVVEYLNNKMAIGDFELQIPLIDAYNALMSDRVTDKEQFINSILAIYGTLLVDDNEKEGEEDAGIKEFKKRLKQYQILPALTSP